MTQDQILSACKTSLRVTTDAFDEEITNYIEAAQQDLAIAGVTFTEVDNLVLTAIMAYTAMKFGQKFENPSTYDKLKAAYDEQKAQLMMATGYTDWSVNNG